MDPRRGCVAVAAAGTQRIRESGTAPPAAHRTQVTHTSRPGSVKSHRGLWLILWFAHFWSLSVGTPVLSNTSGNPTTTHSHSVASMCQVGRETITVQICSPSHLGSHACGVSAGAGFAAQVGRDTKTAQFCSPSHREIQAYFVSDSSPSHLGSHA